MNFILVEQANNIILLQYLIIKQIFVLNQNSILFNKIIEDIFIGMKMKDPIAFEKMIDYYTNDNSLCKHPDQILAEFEDLLTITQFIDSKIPFRIKYIRQKFTESSKSIRNAYKLIERILVEFSDPERQIRLRINPCLGHDIFCRLSHEKLKDEDFKESFTSKQLRLKFLSSRSLPPNVKWHDIYEPTLNILIIEYRQHSIFMNVIPSHGQYIWQLYKVQHIYNQKTLPFFKQYYDSKILKKGKDKYLQQFENYSLSIAIKFLEFIELIEIKQSILMLGGKQISNQTQKISFTYRNIQFQVNFSQLMVDQIPMFSLKMSSITDLFIEMQFRREGTTGKIIFYGEQFICSKYKFNSFRTFLQNLLNLSQTLEKFQKLQKNYPTFFEGIKNSLVIKWDHHYFQHHRNQINLNTYKLIFKEQKNGLYLIGADYQLKNYVILQISRKGKLSSDKLCQRFLMRVAERLQKHNAKILFTFVYLVQKFMRYDANPDIYSITDYDIIKSRNASQEQYKFEIKFKKRVLIEEYILRNSNRQYNMTNIHEYNFLISSIRVEFKLDFTAVEFRGTIKDYDFVFDDVYKTPNYVSMIENKIPADRLTLNTVIKQIYHLRSHAILNRFHETRLSIEIKSKTRILILEE